MGFFFQSDREKMEGLPVAPFMDRDKVTKPTAQIGFIKFVLIPMFETVAKVSHCMSFKVSKLQHRGYVKQKMLITMFVNTDTVYILLHVRIERYCR